MTRHISIASVGAAILAVFFVGCNSPDPAPASSPVAPPGDAPPHDHGDHADSHDHALTDMDVMNLEFASLSTEDADAAKKQHFCPVSDEMLGTMGTPLKVDVDGATVWICCEGCRVELMNNPQEYIAKVNPK